MSQSEKHNSIRIARLRRIRIMIKDTIDETAGMKCGFLVYLLSMAEAEIINMIERTGEVKRKS